MTADVGADLGREAFDRRSWREAYEALASARTLDADALERLAVAAHLIGRDDDSANAWERAHHACLDAGDAERAARCAFWLGLALVLRAEMARGAGWLARAERLVEEAGPRCAARGYLLVPACIGALEAEDVATAAALSEEMVAIAERCADRDLLALAMLCRGQAQMARGDVPGGLRQLDEVMVSVTTGEVAPIPAGIIYCAVIEACVFAFEVRRAAEWTGALHAWCSAEPDLVPYRGQCLVHRSQVLQANGDWDGAVSEAQLATARLADPLHPALGTARYQQGELHRLRGELDDAAAAYRDAGALGRDPSPGIALLRLAEGRVHDASVAIRRMLAEGADPRVRPAVLAAAVEVLVAAGDVDGAGHAAEELAAVAEASGVPALRATADGAVGSVLLARGDADAALAGLRRAVAGWQALGMPYETARARVRLADARRALADDDGAELEREAARATFERLGAAPDLAALDDVTSRRPAPPGELTERELEVLRLVATGRTNREIAAILVISTHTVARHLQNIYVKLDLSSRSAATAWAYEHDVVG